jgi:cyclophilin family peptidyl-prolyl cis-trans isomerase
MALSTSTEKADQSNSKTDTCGLYKREPIWRVAEHQQIHGQGHQKTEKNQQKAKYLDDRKDIKQSHHQDRPDRSRMILANTQPMTAPVNCA